MRGRSSIGKGTRMAEAPVAKPAAPFHRRHRKKLIALGVLFLLPVITHFVIVLWTRMSPPTFAEPNLGAVSKEGEQRRLGRSYVRARGNVLEVRLVGSPEEIGHSHSRLLFDEMVASEGQLYSTLDGLVPWKPFQWLIFDVARVIHAGADRSMSGDRLREIAAQAAAFQPDPFADRFPTFQRLVYLNSLYDIALGFEHSPMMGCTSFAATGAGTSNGHTLLARNFDFEAGSVYDEGKVVFLIREDGKIPFASVAWPGLVGVLSGMNADGLSVVVHGGRARATQAEGEPVVHTTRALLSEAHDVNEAIALLEQREAMVSHILMLSDAKGNAVVVERAPKERPFVRRLEGTKLGLTNHFEGPLESDPKNQRVRESTSTLARRARLDELLANDVPIDVARAVEILRDKKGVGGKELLFGDRTSLDAAIATHAVVMDSTDKVIWVSEGPHLLGRFLKFDLVRLLGSEYEPTQDEPLVALPADPAYVDGTYQQWLEAGAKHHGVE
jgi:isopenicillin-N N-acyltransferase-like protein